MSQLIKNLCAQSSKRKFTRAEALAIVPDLVFDDGRTKQSFEAETNIQKIMARADIGASLSHLEKFENVYSDYSDYDFQTQTQQLAKGQTIFADLPAELRKEFNQSPQDFFNYVNNPANIDDLARLLPDLARPGRQSPAVSPPDADTQAAQAAASEPASATPPPPDPTPDP